MNKNSANNTKAVSLDLYGRDGINVKVGDVTLFVQISPNTPRDNIDTVVRIAIDCDKKNVIMRRGEALGTPYMKKSESANS